MKKCAIVVDSCFNIPNGKYKDLYIIPNIINEEVDGKIVSYRDGETINNDRLCEKLNNNAKISTSTPIIGEFITLITKLSSEYDEVYCLCIPTTISSTYNNWKMAAEDYKNVFVFNQTLVGRLSSWTIDDIVQARDQGKLTKEYVEQLINVSISNRAGVIVVPDVSYLQKGGRVKGFKAFIANALHLKLIISLDKDGLQFRDKSLSIKGAVDKMIIWIDKLIHLKSKQIKRIVIMKSAVSVERFKIDEYVELLKQKFPNVNIEYECLPAVIIAHTGPNYIVLGVEVE